MTRKDENVDSFSLILIQKAVNSLKQTTFVLESVVRPTISDADGVRLRIGSCTKCKICHKICYHTIGQAFTDWSAGDR